MGIKSTKDIYRLVEEKLRSSDKPMTCVALMDDATIRQGALEEFGDDVRNATNKLSDILGFMWRKNVLVRYPAPPESRSQARYAYEWATPAKEEFKPMSPPKRLSKMAVGITEHADCVEIEFDKFVILIRPK